MATWTYDAHGSTDLTNADAYAEGTGTPAPGDTIIITVNTTPSVALSTTGSYHLTFSTALTATVSDFLSAGAIAGTVTFNHAAGTVTLGENFDYTALLINTAATLAWGTRMLTAGAGLTRYQAGTLTGSPAVEFATTGATLNWWGALAVTVNSSVTVTQAASCKITRLGYGGTFAMSTYGCYLSYPNADGFLLGYGAGRITSAARVWFIIQLDADRTIEAILPGGNLDVQLDASTSAKILTVTGDVNVGTYEICPARGTLSVEGNLTCGVVQIGATPATSGKLVLSATGTHSFTSLAINGTGTENDVTFGGSMSVGGNVTLNGLRNIVLGGAMVARATMTIDGTGVTGSLAADAAGFDVFANARAVTVKAAPAGVRTWGKCTDGGGNDAAVAFHPGAPAGRNLLGVGV